MIYRLLYNFFVSLLTLVISLGRFFNPKMAKMWHGRHSQKIAPRDSREVILVHCSSLGEFEQGRVLIESLRERFPQKRLVLSFFSSSGYEMRKNYAGVDEVYYLPLDRARKVRRFIEELQPSEVFIVKYEYWYNFLRELSQSGAKVYIVSAIFRRDSIFFKSCMGFGKFYRSMLGFFTTIFVQDEPSQGLLREIGYVGNVVVAGDTRFDRVVSVTSSAKQNAMVAEFAGGAERVVVCGSTWQPDEVMLVEVMKCHPEWKFIVAPHELSEAHIGTLIQSSQRVASRYTSGTLTQGSTLLVIDTIGLLSGLYRYGDFAYIGGGFGAGIHNTLEAAAWGSAVIFGPKYSKFREARELIEIGAGYSVDSLEGMQVAFNSVASDAQRYGKLAADYVRDGAGATNKIFSTLYNMEYLGLP